jgi:hypothetical protein
MRFGRVYFTRSPSSSLRHRAQPWLLLFVQGSRGARRRLLGHTPAEAEPQGVTLQASLIRNTQPLGTALAWAWRTGEHGGGERETACLREEGTGVSVLVTPDGAARSHKFGLRQSFREIAPVPYGLLRRSSFSTERLVGLWQEPKLKPRSEPCQRPKGRLTPCRLAGCQKRFFYIKSASAISYSSANNIFLSQQISTHH